MGSTSSITRTFDARPDSIDFRDRLFVPTLVDVPAVKPLKKYMDLGLPVLDQGEEGACTGFALAAACHYLLRSSRGTAWTGERVSARMLYAMAKRYDEWPGTEYDGSSARGAMKGWHKHGVCSERLWKSTVANPVDRPVDHLTAKRAAEAAKVPLGAYFRVNHKDLVAMHAAITEVGVLYATALVHAGWLNVGANGFVHESDDQLGGHAFIIVAYDRDGFWIQNSWGADWGKQGFCHVSYSDWLRNGLDIWVARLGVPIRLASGNLSTGRKSGQSTSQFSFGAMRDHVIMLGNDGALNPDGQFGSTEVLVEELFAERIPKQLSKWKNPRTLVYAHGGLVGEKAAFQTVEQNLQKLLDHEIYPLFFVWRTDFWSTIKNIVQDAIRRRKPEGVVDQAKDFMLDRLDDALEPLARHLGGKLLWEEMKENALRATVASAGGARLVAEYLAGLDSAIPIHLIGHSAGSILLAPMAQLLATKGGIETGPMSAYRGFNRRIESCHLWAPACTITLCEETYAPLLRSQSLGRMSVYTLTDDAENDDHCHHVYFKSLLFLVSNAFEPRHRIPVFRPDGEPILGLQRFLDPYKASQLESVTNSGRFRHVLSPNETASGRPFAARANHHGDFDNDANVWASTLAEIVGSKAIEPDIDGAREQRAERVAMRMKLE